MINNENDNHGRNLIFGSAFSPSLGHGTTEMDITDDAHFMLLLD